MAAAMDIFGTLTVKYAKVCMHKNNWLIFVLFRLDVLVW